MIVDASLGADIQSFLAQLKGDKGLVSFASCVCAYRKFEVTFVLFFYLMYKSCIWAILFLLCIASGMIYFA